MTNNILKFKASRWRALVGALVLICAASVGSMAQTGFTPGGTTISNTATSTYSDGTTAYATTSNTVTVTVSNIAGLAITPDGGSHANVAVSQTGVDFLFTVTNTGNFTNQVIFKALGASITTAGAVTVTAAVIDVNKDGLIGVGDTSILSNVADVTSADVLQDGTLFVIVRVDVGASAVAGPTINVQLGDAVGGTPWDNKALVASADDVRTATAGTNGQVEARGNVAATVTGAGSVLLGPSGFPGAFGSGTDTSNDYTNRSVNTGIATVAPGGNTTASGTVVFTNSVQNTGNAADTFTFSAPTIPTLFTVEVSVNGLGTDYVLASTSPTLAVALGATVNILVRVTAPSGNVVLTAFPTVVRATSGTTPAASNDTIDRLYTGYLQLTKTQTVANATGTGDGTFTDPVPGATIAYVVAYDNVTTSGGTNNSTITASSIVLIDPLPANTDFNITSITSNPPAGITVVTAYSSDAGVTWTYTPVSLAGGAPAGYDRLVNRVRFTLTGPMDPATVVGNNGFTVRIR